MNDIITTGLMMAVFFGCGYLLLCDVRTEDEALNGVIALFARVWLVCCLAGLVIVAIAWMMR